MNEFPRISEPSGPVLAGRIPPQNLEAEQAVLGSILLKADVFGSVLEILKPQDFYKEGHKLIFETMTSLFENNEPQDVLTVSNLLRDTNQLEKSRGPLYLATLTSIVPVTANIVS